MVEIEAMRRRLGIVGTAVFLAPAMMALLARPAAAQAPPAPPTVEIGGLVDGYYDYNSNKTDMAYRNFDTKHNQFGFSMAELWVSKSVTADSRAGFKFKTNFGPAAAIIHASEPGTTSIFQNIEEGYVSYLVPAGKGLQFDFGKFVTPHGAEVIEAKDNWNYSRSLLFALAIPYYHMGVKATYAINNKVSVMGNIVNGWNDVVDNNSQRSYGVQATIKPSSALSIVQNYMGGPEQPNNDDDWRHLSDTIVTYTATPKVSVMANYDYGKDTAVGSSVHWDGIALYAKFQANSWVAVVPRWEWFEDPQGFMTGTAQTLKEGTVTLELKGVDNFIWRIEYRGDFSDQAVFKKDTGDMKTSQHTFALGVLYSFAKQ